MYVDDLLGTAKRRWPILVAGVALTAGLVGAALMLVAPTYQILAQVLLVPPQSTEYTNPFFALGGLESATDVVGRAMMSEDVVQESLAAGGTDTFTVERDHLVSGPLLLVTARAPTDRASRATMQLLLDKIPVVLDDLQSAEDVRKKDRIASSIVTQEKDPNVLRKPQIRAVVMALVLGLSATAVLAAIYDGWSRRRQLSAADNRHHLEGSLPNGA